MLVSHSLLLLPCRWTTCCVVIALLLSLGLHPLPAAPAVLEESGLVLPGTPAGRCAASYFEAFNSGDETRVRRYLAEFYPASDPAESSIDKRLGQYRRLRELWGDLKPVRVSESTNLQVTMLVLAASADGGLVFRFRLGEDPPHRIEFLTRSGIDLPADGASGVPDQFIVSVADRARPIDDEIKNDTVQLVAEALRERYVYPEVGAKMAESLIRHEAGGRYREISKARDLAARLTEDLFAISHDRHLAVEAGQPVPEHADIEEVERANYGFSETRSLPGKTGYVKIDVFHDLEGALQAAAAALASVADSGALIFDLREHSGGGGEVGTFILSYFLSRPTLVSTLYDRDGRKVREFRTLADIPGRRFPPDLPVYLLTSSFTGSAAEGFARQFRQLRGATIVGETTQGIAHPSEQIAVNEYFWMWMPFLRPESPVTRDNWEGTGIAPDIPVPAEAALDAAMEDAEKRLRR